MNEDDDKQRNKALVNRARVVIVVSVLILIIILAFTILPSFLNTDKSEKWCGVIDVSMPFLKFDSIHYKETAEFIGSDFNFENGFEVFKQNCSACHSYYKDNKMIGPAVFNVQAMIPTEPKDWIFHYLRNSDSLALKGDTAVLGSRERINDVKWNHTNKGIGEKDFNHLVGFIWMNK